MDISKKIKATLGYVNKSQSELARDFNVTRGAISQRLDRGAFSIPDLEKIAEACGCKFEAYFVFDDGTKI